MAKDPRDDPRVTGVPCGRTGCKNVVPRDQWPARPWPIICDPCQRATMRRPEPK